MGAVMRVNTLQTAQTVERDNGDAIGRARVHDFFGRGHQLDAGPQVYLGRQLDEGSTIYAHFHDVDQFQVIVLGSGRFGRVPVRPITIQYADAFAPYGPIVAEQDGLGFFVFRRQAASGGWKMPGNARLIPKPIGRRFFVDVDDWQTPPSEGGVRREQLWGPATDGLAIELFRLPPSATAVIPLGTAGGLHLMICSGSLVHEAAPLPELSVLLPELGDKNPSITASDDGAVVLALKFPAPSDRPGSDPAKSISEQSAYVRAVGAAR